MKNKQDYEPYPLSKGKRGAPLCVAWQRALLCIDIQYMGCEEGHGVFEGHRKAGIQEPSIQNYLRRIEETVVPNVRRLQDFFRAQNYEVIHTHIESLTQDGRDRSLEHKRLGLHAPPGSHMGRILKEVEPRGDEIVLNKTASGVFVSTNLAYILHNLCVSELFVTGVYTNECVSSAVRSASDLGFDVTLISDATAAITPELHEATLITTKDRYARLLSTDETIAFLKGTSE